MNRTVFKLVADPSRIVVFSEPKTEGYSHCIDGNGWYEKDLIPLNQKELEKFLSSYKDKSIVSILKKAADGTRGGVCSFILLHEGNSIHQAHKSVRAACHAGFVPYNGKTISQAATYNMYFFNEEKKNRAREMVSWLMNGSPWLHCIHPSLWLLTPKERTDWALENPVPLNVEAYANEVIGFCVALRTITEHGWVLDTYEALRKKGLSRAQAFMMTGFLMYCPENGTWEVYANTNWHHYMSISQSVQGLIKFFKEGYYKEDRDTRLFKDKRYSYVASQITPEHGAADSMSTMLGQYLHDEGEGWMKKKVFNVDSFIDTFKKEWNK